MFRKSVGARRRGIGALAVTAALCATALVTTSTVSGADVRQQAKSKIDKTAVIRMGIGVGDNGGSSFDPANSRRIGELIQTLQRSLGATSVVVTHDLELAFAIADRIALLRSGRIALEGPAGELRAGDHPALREFIEGVETLPPGIGTAARLATQEGK